MSDHEVYVVLLPFSRTNPSKYHRVVLSSDWNRYVNDGQQSELYVYAQRNTYQEAQDACDELNGVEK